MFYTQVEVQYLGHLLNDNEFILVRASPSGGDICCVFYDSSTSLRGLQRRGRQLEYHSENQYAAYPTNQRQ